MSTVEVETVYGADTDYHEIQRHLIRVGCPVLGNSSNTHLSNVAKGKGIYFSRLRITIPRHQAGERAAAVPGAPSVMTTMDFAGDEPAKFASLRAREQRFWQKKRRADDEELARQAKDPRTHEDSAGVSSPAEWRDGPSVPFGTDAAAAAALPQPVAYLTGRKLFRGVDFAVNQEVLIPRESSAILVQVALDLVTPAVANLAATGLRVIDLGTGSGCLLLSFMKDYAGGVGGAGGGGNAPAVLPNTDDSKAVRGVGLDISPGALKCAASNAQRLGLSPYVNFVAGDFASLPAVLAAAAAPPGSSPFHLVLCNPPYLDDKKRVAGRGLSAATIAHEPAIAMFAGDKGLGAYKEIARGAVESCRRGLLSSGAHLVLETGAGLADTVTAIFEAAAAQVPAVSLEVVRQADDAQGVVRCVAFRVALETEAHRS